MAFLNSGVFLCHPVSYEFSKGLTADFSFSLLQVRVKVDGQARTQKFLKGGFGTDGEFPRKIAIAFMK